MNYGFVKVAAAVPHVKVADCKFNVERIESLIAVAEGKGVQIIIFPEMSITGYTCGDLFGQDWHFSMPENPPLIPKLAKGGLAYAPTLAMVGDNRNAGTDPEVIAPLSKLKDIIGEGGDMTEVVLLLREILEFLKGLNLIAKGEVDGKTLYRLIVRLNKENTYRTGVNALG